MSGRATSNVERRCTEAVAEAQTTSRNPSLRQTTPWARPVSDTGVRAARRRAAAAVYDRHVPAALEDTLISGFTRLATDAPHRRIDVELRTLDVVLATIFGLIALPFAVVIAILVLVTSGRPVLYRGERVGRRGRF